MILICVRFSLEIRFREQMGVLDQESWILCTTVATNKIDREQLSMQWNFGGTTVKPKLKHCWLCLILPFSLYYTSSHEHWSVCAWSHGRRHQDDPVSPDEQHWDVPLGRPVDLLVSLLVDLNGGHGLLHVAEDHVQVLVVGLGKKQPCLKAIFTCLGEAIWLHVQGKYESPASGWANLSFLVMGFVKHQTRTITNVIEEHQVLTLSLPLSSLSFLILT